MRNTPTARASAGFEPAGMLRARTFPLSISSSRGGRSRRIRAFPTGGRLSPFPSSSPSATRSLAGALGQKMSATSSMSNRDRKLEIPSTHEVLNFESICIQSFSYHVLTLSYRALKRSVSV